MKAERRTGIGDLPARIVACDMRSRHMIFAQGDAVVRCWAIRKELDAQSDRILLASKCCRFVGGPLE